jgi:SAM-dependent methyltransferase
MLEALQTTNKELDTFAYAQNWKSYWMGTIKPFIRGDVLEVGAGIGINTERFVAAHRGPWLCLEPDPECSVRIEELLRDKGLAERCQVVTGTLASLPAGSRFDTVIYIDVLEHIERDREELEKASKLLNPAGCLIVLCPAHQKLYTEFDRAIGHYRRYSREQLVSLNPPAMRLERAYYLDSVGMLLSLGNRFMLRQSMPTLRQILFWDKMIIPFSRLLDPLLNRSLGKTVITIWRKE